MIKLLKRQPKVFYASLFGLMVPMILQNLATQSVALADTFMVGVLGESSLAAVTLANAPFFVLMVFTFGIQSGVGILVAQYWGRGNRDAINRVLGVGLYFAAVVTIIVGTAILLFPNQVLGLVTPEKELVLIGAPYARVVAVSQIFSSVNNIYIAAQRSCGNAKIGVYALTSSSLFNLFGNWVLIFGKFGFPEMGVLGAAVATLASRVLESAIVVVYAFRNKHLPLKLKLMLRPGVVIVRDFIKYSLPVVINEGLWGVALMLYPVIFGHMTNPAALLAAYTIAGNVEKVFTVAVFATGNAAAAIIGKELGAGRHDTIYDTGKSLAVIGLLIGVASSALLLVCTLTLIEPVVYPLFNLSGVAAKGATSMLFVLCACVPLRNLGFAVGIGVLRGGGDVRAMMYIDVCTLYLLGLPFAAITGLLLGADVAVVYASTLLEEVFKSGLILWRFKSRKWIKNITREI
ncbi:MAG: MATE family efflux transporter [Oscillospiraceae bacterium]|jgi:putative MATE family efflux protein|nr:MATE family efflux transporter [Oscillospiraceae bacterium]